MEAQNPVIEQVLVELRLGKKKTHWMWFIFPQLRILGHSELANYFGLDNLAEAINYLEHDILGPRLIQCVQTIMEHSSITATEIFGLVDEKKYRSCLTLFSVASTSATNSKVFNSALAMFFDNQPDQTTLDFIR